MEEQPITTQAGFPNPATDQTLVGLDIASLLVKHPASTFFMRMYGHEREEYGIFNDDIVIVDRSLTPRAQDLVVSWDEIGFRIERFSYCIKNSAVWGVVTSTVHQYRV